MKKLALLFGTLTLGACSVSPPHESVTIRVGDVSCTERIVFDHRNKTSLEVKKYGDAVNTTLGFNLGSIPAIEDPNKPRQRCTAILDIAKGYMESKLDIKKNRSSGKKERS